MNKFNDAVKAAAISYAKAGLYIYPSKPNTKAESLVGSWSKNSSNDPKLAEQRWTQFPGATICLDCGKSNIAVIDVDVKGRTLEAALKALDNVLDIGDEMPATRMQQSPSGGRHFFYKGKIKTTKGATGPDGKITIGFGEGIDTRGVGGMIVLAPTKINGKSYKWIDTRKATPLPEFLADIAGKITNRMAQGDGEFEPAYSNEEFETALNRIPVGRYDNNHDLWLELLLACTHASTVYDGKEAFIAWSCGGESMYASDRDEVAARWDYNYSKRNVKGGVRVGTFNKHLKDADVPDEFIKAPWVTSATNDFKDDVPSDAEIAAHTKAHKATVKEVKNAINKGEIVFTDAATVATQNVDYVWKGRLARGKHTLLAGEAGEGKSQITCDIAARISRGSEWPDKCGNAPKGNVIILSAEDDPADTLVPRLVAAGADLRYIKILKAVQDKTGTRKFNLEMDIPRLMSACKQLGDVVLIVIDPVSSYMGGKIKGGDNTQVRHVLDPLSDLAVDLRCAILSITHFRKGAEGPKAVHRIMDSIAFGAAPRATFGVYRDPTDIDGYDDPRVLLLFKTNLPDKAKGLKYKIRETTGGIDKRDGKPIKALRIEWLGVTDLDADTVQRMENEQRAAPKLDEAMTFYSDALATGPVLVAETDARAADLGLKTDTLRRARGKMKIKGRPRAGTAASGVPPQWEYAYINDADDFRP